MTKKASLAILCLVLLGIAAVLFVFGTQQLYPEEIDYNGQTLTWSKIPFADHYEIYIDDQEPIVQTAASYTFPNGGSFRVRIVVHKKFGALFKPCEASQSFTFLPKVTELAYQNGILTWKAIEQATSYEVKATTPAGTSSFYPTENSLPYTEAGPVTFEVIARGENSADYSYWSNKYEISILGAPQSVSYDAASNLLSWSAVGGASGYHVSINGQAAATVTEPSFSFDADAQSFSVAIQAVGDADARVFDSQYTPAKTYTYLSGVTQTSVHFADGVLTWDAVEGVTDYYLTVGGERHTVTGTRYAGLAPTTAHEISLIPVCPMNAYSYPTSATLSYLATPVVSILQTNTGAAQFTWTAIEGADRYVGVLEKDGAVLLSNIALTEPTYTNALAATGRYTFTVRAVSDTATCYDSAAAAPTAAVRMAPCSGSSISADRTALHFEPIEGARTYYLAISNGVNCEEWQHTFLPLSNYTSAGTYTVKIYANSYVHEDGTLYLASPTSHDATFTKLAAPTAFLAGKTGDLVNLQWSAVTGAGGYLLQVERTDEQYGTVTIELGRTQTSIGWTELLTKLKNENRAWTDGVYEIRISAIGTGDYLSSSFVGDVTIHAFAAPTNLRAEGSILTWDGAGASGYTYRISFANGTHTELTTGNSIDLLALNGYKIPTSNGILISVTTISGPSTAVGAITACSPVVLWTTTAQTLTAPQNVLYRDGALTWDAVEHASAYTVQIGYRDGDAIVTVHTLTDLTARTLRRADFEAYLTEGRANVLTVIAQGETASGGVYYLSSDGATSADLTVLATPTLSYDAATHTVSWTNVSGSYEVVISDEQGPLSTMSNRFSSTTLPAFTAGEHTVYVQFVATADNTISSAIAQIQITVS